MGDRNTPLSDQSFGLNKRTLTAFEKKNISTVDDVVRYLPSRYRDYSVPICPNTSLIDEDVALIGTFVSYDTFDYQGKTCLCAVFIEEYTKQKTYVTWFGNYYFINYLAYIEPGTGVICAGKLKYNSYKKAFEMSNPFIFSKNISGSLKVFPIYRKVKGVSEVSCSHILRDCLDIFPDDDYFPPSELIKEGVVREKEALRSSGGNSRQFNCRDESPLFCCFCCVAFGILYL